MVSVEKRVAWSHCLVVLGDDEGCANVNGKLYRDWIKLIMMHFNVSMQKLCVCSRAYSEQ